MFMVIDNEDDADLSAVVRALVRFATAEDVSNEPEKDEAGSAVREKKPVAIAMTPSPPPLLPPVAVKKLN